LDLNGFMRFIHLVNQGVNILSGFGGSKSSHSVRNNVHIKPTPSRSLILHMFCTLSIADSWLIGVPQFSFGKLSGRRDIGPRTPTPGPILFRLRLDETGTPQFSFGKLSGRRDLNPGPPNSHPFSRLRSVRCEGVVS
jgi:hypothetical protein